jgi:hypothetical protein
MSRTVVDVVHETPAPDNATVRTTFPLPELLSDAEIHAALEEIDRVALFSALSPAAERFTSLCTTELAQRAHRAKVDVKAIEEAARESAEALEALYLEAIDRLADAVAAVEAVQGARPDFEQAWATAQKSGVQVPHRPMRFANRAVSDIPTRDLGDRMKVALMGGW